MAALGFRSRTWPRSPRCRAASASAWYGLARSSASSVDSSHLFMDANGLGLKAVSGKDYCRVVIQYPSNTVSKWVSTCFLCQTDPSTGKVEGLSFEFNLCEAVASWEQVRNSTTVLTKEYIDALPNGWEEYAWRRINKGNLLNKCQNRTLCMEKLSLVLPETSPYVPRQFGRCAVVGNSGDLLKTKFGDEIDSYDVVFRENGAPIQNYTEYVGTKSTFRLLNRGSAKALDKVVELDETKKEVLIVKTTIHDIMNQMIREVPITNPVYLMLGTSSSFGSSAKGTGVKAIEFALSICDSVDMYGFTVDPGYKEWTRYFSEARKGHTPLHGRAYYQMMECLGLVKIHSPMRGDPGRAVKWLPTKDIIEAARVASEKLLRRPGAGSDGPLETCTMIKKRNKGKAPNRSGLRDAAMKHLEYMKGATRYPLERSAEGGYLCMINDT
ncbi:sialyltransferase-like protein 4 isoform X3 [Panicum virgatum]|uniref:sialyltransferase-like protein 4 isoform X3 n=1 Tax=Panicum virgatum TaxID=38727 RepID=UPI0019D57370|nr:sialyltransferase-like protein 4 isoform X3 [Panicum virgatum]